MVFSVRLIFAVLLKNATSIALTTSRVITGQKSDDLASIDLQIDGLISDLDAQRKATEIDRKVEAEIEDLLSASNHTQFPFASSGEVRSSVSGIQ